MSNILIIKHGSLGDIIQANGAIKDIKQNFPNYKVMLLTTPPYANFMSSCPYIDGVLIDKRLPRWNLFYLKKLSDMLKRFSFEKVFDLQNSSRTKFYKKFLFKKNIFWSDSESFSDQDTILNEKNLPVLDRMKSQLVRAGINKTEFTKKPDFEWTFKNIKNLINQYFEGEYILIFPFCSPKLTKKKWPYYSKLIDLIKKNYGSKYSIAIAPGPKELIESKSYNASIILKDGNSLSIIELINLIKNSSFIISNDTGPAHISSHLNKKGLVLFGSHTTPDKVSMYSENFKVIEEKKLENLSAEKVFAQVKERLG